MRNWTAGLLGLLFLLSLMIPSLASQKVELDSDMTFQGARSTAWEALDFKRQTGKLKFSFNFVPPVDTKQYWHHRNLLITASKFFSELIRDDVVIRVKVTATPKENYLAAAGPVTQQVRISDLIPLLQQKYRSHGYGFKLPSATALEKLLCNPKAGCNGMITLPAPVAKVLLTPKSFQTIFGNIAADMVVYVTPAITADVSTTPPVGANPGKQYLLCGMIHELEHGLGFMSSVGEGNAPHLLDLFRFAEGTNVNFMTSRRYLDDVKDASTGFSNGLALAGRVSFPLFGRGRQAAHWRQPEDPVDNKKRYYMGVMDAGGDRTMLVPYTFSVADREVLASLGYNINRLPKPVLGQLWRKRLPSGVYIGVSGHLLSARTIEFAFVSSSGVQHLVRTLSTTMMTSSEAGSDIGQLLDRRKNYLTVFNFNPKIGLPNLKSSSSWRIFARNVEGSQRSFDGSWSIPITFNGDWMKIKEVIDWDWERAATRIVNPLPQLVKLTNYPNVKGKISPDPSTSQNSKSR